MKYMPPAENPVTKKEFYAEIESISMKRCFEDLEYYMLYMSSDNCTAIVIRVSKGGTVSVLPPGIKNS
jgi:hypothetical protein